MGRAMVQRQLAFFVRTGRTYQRDTFGLRPLAGNQANAASSGVKQHRVACLQGCRPMEQVFDGHALQHHRRALFKRNIVRQRTNLCCGHHTCFAIYTRRGSSISRAITRLKMGNTLAHCLDNTGGFHTQRMRQIERIKPGALIHVDEIQTTGFVLDPDLPGTGFADIADHQFQFFRSAKFFDNRRQCHCLSSPVGTCSLAARHVQNDFADMVRTFQPRVRPGGIGQIEFAVHNRRHPAR